MSMLKSPFRLPRLSPYVPEQDDPPIFWFNSERDDIVREVVRRVVDRHGRERKGLEYALNEVAYHETRRLEGQRDDEARQELGYWRGLLRRVARMSDEAKRDALEGIARRMATDIAGNFDPRVYRMATYAAPQLLTGFLRPASFAPPPALTSWIPGRRPDAGPLRRLDEMVQTSGDAARLRRLEKKGTLVYVPTHSSNLDSVALGYVLYREGLSPVVYGAGKNLFTNPIISFFMHNLGAYRVDRRIRATLYKDTLKTYSAVLIERGFHSLFFPGGTRSRSGMVERRLKLGLAGTATEAFARSQVYRVKRPVFFVPTTINYGLVMEAESLIEDHLQEKGRERYIIDDDEFSSVERWLAFFRRLTAMEAACVIRFADPVDPFGNPVDDEGRSVAPSGKAFDPGTYVFRAGRPVLDEARDAAYTRDLGERLLEIFRRETVLMTENLVAHVLFRRLVADTPGVDLFGRLRFRGDVRMKREELHREVGEARDRLRELAAKGVVHASDALRHRTPEALVSDAFKTWDGYHSRPLAKDAGPNVVIEDPSLLLYYQNRTVDYAEGLAPARLARVAREIGQLGVQP